MVYIVLLHVEKWVSSASSCCSVLFYLGLFCFCFFFLIPSTRSQICMLYVCLLQLLLMLIPRNLWGGRKVLVICSISLPFDVDRGASVFFFSREREHLSAPLFHFQTAVGGCVSIEIIKTADFVSQRSSPWCCV